MEVKIPSPRRGWKPRTPIVQVLLVRQSKCSLFKHRYM